MSTEVRYRLLGEAVKRLAGQIEAVAECLLRATRLVEESAPCCGKSAGRSRQYADWLAERLRLELQAARAWQQAVCNDRELNVVRLQGALAILRRSVDRASLLLAQTEIVLAIGGATTVTLSDEG